MSANSKGLSDHNFRNRVYAASQCGGILLLLLASLDVPLAIGAGALPAPLRSSPAVGGTEEHYLILESAPLAQTVGRARVNLKDLTLAAETKRRGAQLMAEHASLQAQLESGGVRVSGHMMRLVNAIRVSAPTDKARVLSALPGVRSVFPVRLHTPSLTHSVPFIGTSEIWGPSVPKADGRKLRIGIIDTGIDYTHADFGGSGKVEDYQRNDPTRVEPGTFPTEKVIGGYDFVGDDYNAGDPGHSIPHPDPDPLDSKRGHGTHVAGIAAGLGVLTNGATYTGEYSNELDLGTFMVGPGVAPRAFLYALKIFGPEGSTALVVDALEWAADPNGDFDFSDRLDVVNLSLGSTFGTHDPEDPEIVSVNHLAQLGCVVVCAAGNDGNIFYASGPPGSASRAIAVGNSIDKTVGSAIRIESPASIAGNYYAVEGAFTAPLEKTGPIVGTLVYVEPNQACETLTNATALQGKIALIDRGNCFFVDKIQRAQDAGAIAVVMVNNNLEDPIVMGGTSSTITIPGVMVSKADGLLLKIHLEDPLTIRLDSTLKVMRRALRDSLSADSSRGPVGLAQYLKPEVVAPGTSILSASSGEGTLGRTLSGTSMASPHVAGVAALLRQIHPDWSVEEIKAAIMNSAVSTRDRNSFYYPESWTGAGRVQADLAAQLEITAVAAGSDGNVALTFGSLVLDRLFVTNRVVVLTNHGTNEVVLQVATGETVSQQGVSLTPATNVIALPPHASVPLTLTFRADPALFRLQHDDSTDPYTLEEPRNALFEASGLIWFAHGSEVLRLPYHATLHAASSFSASTNRIPLGPELSAQQEAFVTVPIIGNSVQAGAVVSAFELGTTLPNQNLLSIYHSDANLLAVGAASDYAQAGAVSNANVFFGLATATSWPTPQPSYVLFLVQIDTNYDGLADFTLHNNTAAYTQEDMAAADVFITLVQGLDENGEWKDAEFASYLNFFAVDELDAAPFNNSVMVLAAAAGQVGLNENQSHFRYRAVSYGISRLVSQTGWISYDVRRPTVETSSSGLRGTPLHLDGKPLVAKIDRSAAADYRQRIPGLLLLHHHNVEGERAEIIRFDLSQDDMDGDGLPDWWEIQHFNGLIYSASETDSDGDDMTDFAEFRAGTDPRDEASALRGLSAEPQGTNGVLLSWSSAPGKMYTILSSTNLASPDWEAVAADQFATPPTNQFSSTNRANRPFEYFRIQVQ